MALDLGEMLRGSIGLDTSKFSSGLDGAMGKLKDFGGKGLKVAATAGAGVATAFVGSVAAGMSVEAGTDKLAAQLGLSTKESQRAGKIAGELYAGAWGENRGQVNDAVGAVMSSIRGMADASGAQIERATQKALDFATAFDVDVNRAVQVAGQAVSTGLAKNATQAFDLITAASQRVPAALREDVLDAADEYGQFFSTLGYDGEQAFAMLVKGAEDGMYGIDKAGDAIKEFTIRSTDMSDLSKDAYSSIGLNARNMANQILAGGDSAQGATQKIIDGLLKIKDPAKQAEAAIALFGTPLEDLNVKEIPTFLKSMKGGGDAMKGFEGASKRMGDTLNDNATVALTSLKRQGEQAFLMLGDWALPKVNEMTTALAANLGPALRKVGDWLQNPVLPSLKQLGRFVSDNQKPIMVVSGLIAAVFIPHLIALGVASGVARVKVVAAWVAKRGAAVKAAAVHSAAIVRMIAKYALLGAKSLIHAAKVAASWIIAMGPVAWVIATVVAVGLVVWRNWDKIKKWTAAAWGWVWGKVKAIGNLIVGFFRNWTLAGLIIQHWDRIRSGVASKAEALVEFVRRIPERIVAAIGNLGSLLKSAGVSVVTGLWEGIQSMGSWLVSQLTSWVADKIPGPIRKALGIASPSRVMRDLARNVPEGMALGILDGSPAVAAAAQRMAGAAIPRVSRVGSPQGLGTGASGGPRMHAPITVNMPVTTDPEAAYAAAGGRIVAALSAVGV